MLILPGNLDSRALSQVVQVLKDRQHLVVIDALGDQNAATRTLQQLMLIDVSTVIVFREESEETGAAHFLFSLSPPAASPISFWVQSTIKAGLVQDAAERVLQQTQVKETLEKIVPGLINFVVGRTSKRLVGAFDRGWQPVTVYYQKPSAAGLESAFAKQLPKRYISKFESPQQLHETMAIEFDAVVASTTLFHFLTPDGQSRMLFAKELSQFKFNIECLQSLILVEDATGH